MTAFTPPHRDRPLDLHELLRALVAQGRLYDADAERCLALRHSRDAAQHPLELIAAQQLDDRARPGQPLDLEALTQWLAAFAGQPYLRIDPLKIDAAALTPLMSHAFAQRHGILVVALDEQGLTVASAQPFVRGWEADLVQVLRRPIRRVVANPAEIRRFIAEFHRLARSVSGASGGGAKTPGSGNFEQLLDLGAQDGSADANDAHVVTIVDWLFHYAFQQRASDIHYRTAPRADHGALSHRRGAAQRLPVSAAGRHGSDQPPQVPRPHERGGKTQAAGRPGQDPHPGGLEQLA